MTVRAFAVAAVGAAAVVVVLASGCSLNDDGPNLAGNATTVPGDLSRVTSSTTPAATTAPALSASGVLTSPEAAAAWLFNAWRNGNRTSAGRFASDAAVETLFGHDFNQPAPAFESCSSGGGLTVCLYTFSGGSIAMYVNGDATSGYTVNAVDYSTS